ncbi:hypothetical protein CYMTET_39244 [Cymbomonas tetramitiformis]|uniref:Uncharacterized protein n=1 Tax=Cymbomonas tetramitiformis TaxID=36881 RepID=A0AAE0CC56_9CHLO|nr:hypothetical protein CYMTET_39244 [Cymbomonas tetramitiformis]
MDWLRDVRLLEVVHLLWDVHLLGEVQPLGAGHLREDGHPLGAVHLPRDVQMWGALHLICGGPLLGACAPIALGWGDGLLVGGEHLWWSVHLLGMVHRRRKVHLGVMLW